MRALLLSALLIWVRLECAAQEPQLPTWDPRAATSAEPSGAALIPFLPPPSMEAGAEPTLPRQAQPLFMEDDEGLQSDDLHLFLPLSSARHIRPPLAANPPLRELPSLYAESLRHWPEHSHLMDPQTLLTEVPRQDLQRLLHFHAREARTRLYILVLDKDQTLPAGLAPEALAGGHVTGDHAVLIVCPMGETWRSRFFFGTRLRQGSPSSYLREMIRDCVNDSQQAREHDEQLHRLVVRASTWLFRLESQLPARPLPPLQKGTLHEISEMRAVSKSIERLPLSTSGIGLLIAILGAVITCALGILVRRFRRHRASSQVWIIDEPEIPPRLGGVFCGGSCARLMADGKILPS